jgi:tRNA A-37 threonylcarbamoyl transferase component Bud32
VLVTRLVDGVGPWQIAPPALEDLLPCLAAGIARLHAAGFRHRDLKASNLLVRRSRPHLELVWIDLEGLTWRGTVELHLRARDLARLCTSFSSAEARTAGVRADAWPALVRFYLECALGRTPETEELEKLLTRTRAWSDRNIRRHLATDRPVK